MKRLVLILTLFAFLSACGGDRQKELEAYIKDVKAKSIGSVEPLPEIKPYKTFVYSATDLRSPFQPPIKETKIVAGMNDNGIHPDQYRRKEPLEKFALDSLRMVGTLEQNGKIWAVVVDTDKTVHRVTVGNYVGQNDGKIDKVTEEKVYLTEIVPDTQGGWRKQKAEMALVE